MISRINGKVVSKGIKYVVVETSGIGYKVFVTPQTLSELPKEEIAQIWTYLAVRENSLDLYGFLVKDDLEFFELLISISGIGPKGALGILSAVDAKTLSSAISSGDTSYLTKVSGIGKKSAEKIVMELKDKIGILDIEDQTGNLRTETDAVEALKALGYRHDEAREALKQVSSKTTEVSEKVREALRGLGK